MHFSKKIFGEFFFFTTFADVFNLNLITMKKLANEIAALCAAIQADIEKVDTNKAAAARVRKATLELAKVGKEFRKVSVAASKK